MVFTIYSRQRLPPTQTTETSKKWSTLRSADSVTDALFRAGDIRRQQHDAWVSETEHGGLFAGLIMGDMTTGLSSRHPEPAGTGRGQLRRRVDPDYMTGAVLGTTFAIISGQGAAFGATIAVPIGLLMVQLDILARFSNTFIHHKADRLIEEGQVKAAARMNLLGQVLFRSRVCCRAVGADPRGNLC